MVLSTDSSYWNLHQHSVATLAHEPVRSRFAITERRMWSCWSDDMSELNLEGLAFVS